MYRLNMKNAMSVKGFCISKLKNRNCKSSQRVRWSGCEPSGERSECGGLQVGHAQSTGRRCCLAPASLRKFFVFTSGGKSVCAYLVSGKGMEKQF